MPIKATILFGTISGGLGDVLSLSKYAELSGGIPITIGIWQGAATGLMVSGLNHWAHMAQKPEYSNMWFSSKDAAYSYAEKLSTIAGVEVVGVELCEEGFIVFAVSSKNTYTHASSEPGKLRYNQGIMQVLFEGDLYDVKSLFHTHPGKVLYYQF